MMFMKTFTQPFMQTLPRQAGGVILFALMTTACLTAGTGRVKLIPGAEHVGIVRSSDRVLQCVRLRDSSFVKIERELLQFGVSEASLFPDLDHLTKELSRSYGFH